MSQSRGGRSGVLFAIVGPSGAGKDTLINWLRDRLVHQPEIMFVRRTITRPPDGATEEHDTLDQAAFIAAEKAGRFSVTWQAHGLRYGLPATTLEHVRSGGIAICNGSRGALTNMQAVFENLRVVEISVSPQVLAERLRARGRETEADIEARLARTTPPIPDHFTVIAVDNSGAVENAGNAVLERLRDHLSA